MAEQTPDFRLMDRDRLIVEHVARYRMTIREIVHAHFMPETDINAVTKVLARLTGARLLARHTLHDSRGYWTLGLLGARQRGLHEKRAYAVGYNAVIEHYGILAFCCAGNTRRELLTREEFEERFPGHSHPSIQRPAYYIDEHDGIRRLGMIVVDRNGDPIRLIRKCMGEMRRRVSIPAFLARFRQQDFVCAIVTGDPERKQVLERLLAKEQTRSVLFRVVVRQGLAALWVNHAHRR